MPRHAPLSPMNEEFRRSQLIETKINIKPVTLVLPKAHPRQYEFITSLEKHPEVRFVVGACGTKFGKALKTKELLPTPSGWKTVAEIQEGDYVFDHEGNPSLVEFATDVMYDHKCYKVTFSDGKSVEVDAEHLWETETHAARKAQARVKSPNDRCKSTTMGPSVLTTEEIKNTLHVTISGRQRPNHSVLVCGPVQFPKQSLLVDPYVLGYWLGDGGKGSCRITSSEVDSIHLKEQFLALGYQVTNNADPQAFGVLKLRSLLDQLGVLNNKHVPPQYLIGSVEQRLALLQGLMDTDGTISKRGDCTFDNTNKALADAVDELACSLGIKTNRQERYWKLNGVEKKLCYRVHFTTDLPVFRLKRKLERIRPVAAKAKLRYIVDVTEVLSEPVRCIRIANPRHLFLVSKAYIPTHNTFGSTIAMVLRAWNYPNTLNWWVSPTFAQSKMAYTLIKRLLPKDSYVEYKADLKLVLLDPNGNEHSVIEFKSGDNPDSLRGFGVHFFVMDEAARCPYDSFVSLLTTVTQTRGKGFFISTPKGRGWFYEQYQKGIKFDEDTGEPIYGPDNPDENPEWVSIRMPTWTNPHVSIESINEMRRNLPEDVFQQEVAAQFLLDSAGVFRGISKCIKGQLHPPAPGARYVMGVDLARLKDYSVLTVMDKQTRHVVYFERFNQISWETQSQRIVEIAKKYRAEVVIDSTGLGDPIVERIQNYGVMVSPYKISGNTAKRQLIDKLRVNIENATISFPMIPILKKELEAYEYEVGDNGMVKFSAPTGQHDDCVISLALACWGADQAPWVYHYKSVRGI
jgi:hypothetical protein